MERWKAAIPALLLLAIGAAACVKLHYHIGGIALLFGTVLWLRAGVRNYSRLLLIGAVVVGTALVQFYLLHRHRRISRPDDNRCIRRNAQCLADVAVRGIQPGRHCSACRSRLPMECIGCARGTRLPVHFLFFAIAVWAPLFAIGLVRWNVAERYTIGALPFFLLALVAGVAYLLQSTGWGCKAAREFECDSRGRRGAGRRHRQSHRGLAGRKERLSAIIPITRAPRNSSRVLNPSAIGHHDSRGFDQPDVLPWQSGLPLAECRGRHESLRC